MKEIQDRETAIETLEENIGDGWGNFGDAHPAEHGGAFCRYNFGKRQFQVVKTFMAADMGLPDQDHPDYGHQAVWAATVDWRDLLEETESGVETSDLLSSELSSLSNATDSLDWLAADEIDIRGHVAHMGSELASFREVSEDSYEAVVERFGVDLEEAEW